MKKFYVLASLIFVVTLHSSDKSYLCNFSDGNSQDFLHQEMLTEECGDFCQQDSACCLVPYAVEQVFFTGVNFGIECLGSGALATCNLLNACISPKKTVLHPLNALRSIFYPVGNIALMPGRQFYRIAVCVKSLNPEYFAERELAKIKGAWLEKNCIAEDFFIKNPDHAVKFWHSLNRLYLLAQGKESPTLSEKQSNRFLATYYKQMGDFFGSHSKDKVDSLDTVFKNIFLAEGHKASFAEILFKRSRVKERAKLAALDCVTRSKNPWDMHQIIINQLPQSSIVKI